MDRRRQGEKLEVRQTVTQELNEKISGLKKLRRRVKRALHDVEWSGATEHEHVR